MLIQKIMRNDEQESMKMRDGSTTLVAPQPKGIIDPATGKPIGGDGMFFGEISDELADRVFL